MNSDFDLKNSFVIGDRQSDVQLAKNLGSKAIYLNSKPHPDAVLATTNWDEICRFLCYPPRTAEVNRKTTETEISIQLNLDGNGQYDIETGLGFFDHLLEQISRHSGCDLSVRARGDLHRDEHHTIEDTGLCLGEAVKKALGDKKGIERYGFLLPMDDSLAQVALDFSGRNWLVWNVEFSREKIGDMPTEMFRHFFKSFSDTAGCNMNIQASGENEHHKIESICKAFGKSIRQAVQRQSGRKEIPSTKGIL